MQRRSSLKKTLQLVSPAILTAGLFIGQPYCISHSQIPLHSSTLGSFRVFAQTDSKETSPSIFRERSSLYLIVIVILIGYGGINTHLLLKARQQLKHGLQDQASFKRDYEHHLHVLQDKNTLLEQNLDELKNSQQELQATIHHLNQQSESQVKILQRQLHQTLKEQDNLKQNQHQQLELIAQLQQEKEELQRVENELNSFNKMYEEDYVKTTQENTVLSKRISFLEQEKDKFETDRKWLNHEKKRLEYKVVELLEILYQQENEQQKTSTNLRFKNLQDVLTRAAQDFPILKIWESAQKSVTTENYQHYDFIGVYNAFKALAEIGNIYFECKKCEVEIGHRWQEEFEKKGVTHYRPHESEATMTRYGHQRMFYHNGIKKTMTQHLTFRNRDKAIQIFFSKDEESETIDIGYCGKHLDYVNRNT